MPNTMNEADYFWKNFRLGTELQTSGNFIYNSLYFFDKLEYMRFEEDIFEFLYSISVGVERIQKIAIILLEHNSITNQEEFEKSLITHNHIELLKRIKGNTELKFGKIHSKFLGLLSEFYNSHRYKRFNKSSVYHKNFDKFDFLEFISKELKINIEDGDYIQNTDQIKRFVGKIISKIVCDIYQIIRNTAHKIGTFTYEIRYNSKAFKIFISKEYTFEEENNFKREIIINLLHENGIKDEFIDYIKTIEPLELTSYNSSYYIKYLFNSVFDQNCIEEYEHLKYEKMIPRKRNEEIDCIGENHYLHSEMEDFEDDL